MADTVSYLLKEDGDKLLQETGSKILLETQAVSVNGVTQTGVMLGGFSLTECANRGEVGTGGFDVYDSAAALTISGLSRSRSASRCASPTRCSSRAGRMSGSSRPFRTASPERGAWRWSTRTSSPAISS
jgi:hypothetical protein